ncbi:hypothetical protein AAVH_24964 [Aphelenchoides avenae]|nr:hypothetical protein AAVH_24964 [Aphelenchus avenae]
MLLPTEVLLEILSCLERRDLDWLPLASRYLHRVVDVNTDVLARRHIDKALIRNPKVKEEPPSKLKAFFTPASREGQRAVVIDADGRRLRFIGSFDDQVEWAMYALRGSRVELLRFGCTDEKYGHMYFSKKAAKKVINAAGSISVGQLHFWKVDLMWLKTRHFAQLLLSFESLETFNPFGTKCHGRQITDEFLRLAAEKGLRFPKFHTRIEELWLDRLLGRAPSWIRFRCAATDDAVLNYLCNEAYPQKSRYLRLNKFRASKQFLQTLIERFHAVTRIEDIRLEVGIRFHEQDLGKYADEVLLTLSDGLLYRVLVLRTEEYCIKIIANTGYRHLFCCCTYTKVQNESSAEPTL